MTRAYVLVNTRAGTTQAVQQALQAKPGIRTADIVVGPHDVIVLLEAADLNDVARFVLREVHGTEGVLNTLTYPVVEPGA